MLSRRLIAGSIAIVMVAVACGAEPDAGVGDAVDTSPELVEQVPVLVRDPDVIVLPFADNPDPDQCGIPVKFGGAQAWLTGRWQGEMLQPDVQLYDSHQRLHVTGTAPHGAEVDVVLYQENPVLDFYMVDVVGRPHVSGWVPAPFLSFEPIG